MKKILFCSLTLFAQISGQTQSFDIGYFHYLEGKWIINENGSSIHEEWKRESDTLLTSFSYYVEDGDTTYSETVMLQKIGKDIFYIPAVEHNPGQVRFKLTSLIENTALFENPEHDFPAKIIYKKINIDSLHASVEGMTEGKVKIINYPFRRVK